jgi:hypothetical protein
MKMPPSFPHFALFSLDIFWQFIAHHQFSFGEGEKGQNSISLFFLSPPICWPIGLMPTCPPPQQQQQQPR